MVELVSLIKSITAARVELFTPGRPGHQHDAVLNLDDLFQLFGKTKVAEPWRAHRDYSHHNGMRPPLLEDIHAKASVSRCTKRQICGAGLIQTFVGGLLISHDEFGDAGGVGRREFLQAPGC